MKKDIRPILSLDVYEDSSQQPSKNPTNKAPKSRNKERKKRRSNITFFIYHKTRNRHWICIQVKLSRALSLSPEQYNFKNCNLLTIKSMLQLKDEKCSYEDIQKNQNKTIAGSSSECVKIEYIKVEHSEFQTNLTNNERCHENEQGNIIQNEQCSYEDIQKKQNKTIAGSSSEYVNIGYIKSEHGEFQTNITNNERCHENEQKNKIKEEKCGYEDIHKNQNKTIAEISSECANIKYIKSEHGEFQTNITNNERCHENEQENIIQNEQSSYEDTQKNQTKTIEGSSSECVNIGYINSEPGAFRTYITNNESCHKNEQENKIKKIAITETENLREYPERLMSLLNWQNNILNTLNNQSTVENSKNDHSNSQLTLTYVRTYRRYPAKTRADMIKKVPMTSTERVRKYRERRKSLLNLQNNIFNALNNQSTVENTTNNHSEYRINITDDGKDRENGQVNIIKKVPKTSTERSRESRKRRKALLNLTNNEKCCESKKVKKIKKAPNSSTERVRRYRERRKALLNLINNEKCCENKKAPMSSTERVRKYRERRKQLLNLQNKISNALNYQSTVKNSISDHSESRTNITNDEKCHENEQKNKIKVEKCGYEDIEKNQNKTIAGSSRECVNIEYIKSEHSESRTNITNDEKCREKEQENIIQNEQCSYEDKQKNQNKTIAGSSSECVTIEYIKIDHSESRTNITNDERCHENEQENKIKEESCGSEDIHKNQNKTIAGSLSECVNIEYIKSDHSISQSTLPNAEIYPRCRENMIKKVPKNSTERVRAFRQRRKALLDFQKHFLNTLNSVSTVENIENDDHKFWQKKRANKIIKVPKSSTERVRKYRARQKALLNVLSNACIACNNACTLINSGNDYHDSQMDIVNCISSDSQAKLIDAEKCCSYRQCQEEKDIEELLDTSTEGVLTFVLQETLLNMQNNILNASSNGSTIQNSENDDHNNIMPKKSNLENSAGNVAQRTRSKMNYLKKSQEQHDESLEKNIPTKQTMCQNCLTVSKALIQKSSYARTKERSVQPLIVHLENVSVHYIKDNVPRKVPEPPQTTLTEFFKLCQTTDIFGLFARTLIYTDVPHYFIWNYTTKKWVPRIQGEPHPTIANIFKGKTVGQIFHLYSKQPECIFLELLLGKIPGPTSFEYLRTINGKVFSTYQDACRELKLL
ncbi:PREDICTED: centromere-associated protein E-like isoform X3 [Polistes dominula]|uniref:Centromere-associated protein E-like isoform X3 n=1 Tax=Polistes dominula TaxID=743375 RepID=A0ABM1JA36_POLDO|nr:PREDICTED: centromere-associated protein E-like isoform X3 [Polistes dominula]